MVKRLVVYFIALSFIVVMLPKAKAVEFSPLPNPVLVEYYTDHVEPRFESWDWIHRSYVQNPQNSFFAINFHQTDPIGIREAYDRHVTFYNNKVVPIIVINGTEIIDSSKNSIWPNTIKKAVEIKRYPIQISIIVGEKSQSKIKFLTTENLGKRKLNFNVVLFEDWVNYKTNINETTHRNLARNMPLGATGQGLNLTKDTVVEKNFTFQIKAKDARLNQMGIIGFVQDMETKEILGTGLYRFSNEEPVYFNWNHWPNNINDNNQVSIPQYRQHIGYSEMIFSAEKMKDIKKISFSIFYGTEERKYYEILGVKKLYPNCDIVFKKPSTVEITFKTPVSGNENIFEFVVHYYKTTFDDWAVSFKVENFQVFDKNNVTPRYDINNPQLYYDVCLAIYPNPLNFNEDTEINDKDLKELLPYFGLNTDDGKFEKVYDIDNSDNLNRIDMRDISKLIVYIRDQELLLKSIEGE